MMEMGQSSARSDSEGRVQALISKADSLFGRPASSRVEVLREGWFYLPQYLIAPEDGRISLFVRQAREQRSRQSGKVRTLMQTTVISLPDEEAMVEWIDEHRAEELPAEADGNNAYLPEGWR